MLRSEHNTEEGSSQDLKVCIKIVVRIGAKDPPPGGKRVTDRSILT